MSVTDSQRAMLQALFASIDARDPEGFLAQLTEGSTFRFGSSPAVRGRAAIGEAVEGFFSTIAGLNHDLSNVMANGSTLVCEGEVTYTRHDDSTITLPFVDVFELDGDLIRNYKIYMDIGPLYAE